ncbi:hypothetical protein CCH79_00020991, partial [Gambusia affinis]
MGRLALLFFLLLSLSLVTAQVSYSIPEESPKGSLIGNIARDLGLDGKRLLSGNARIFTGDNTDYIDLKRERGVLIVKDKIDRELLCGQTTPCALHFQVILENPMEFYTVAVEIVDINDNAPLFEKSDMTFKIRVPSLSSSVTLALQVSDVNDNAPVFERSSYEAYIVENNTP